MPRFRTLGIGLAALVATTFNSVDSLAAPAVPDSDTVVFVGALAANVPWIGGNGNYNFAAAGFPNCTVESVDHVGQPMDPPVTGCILNSPTGRFNNLICGTGTASDAGATLIENGDGDTYDVTYTILFVGGIGILTGTAFDRSDGNQGNLVSGVVVIVPAGGFAPNPNVANWGLCANNFIVAGTITTTA